MPNNFVYVLNKHGDPLMPCSPRKGRLLLKDKKVRVVKRTPFTIQLLHGSSGYKQPITLGVDAGSKHIGISATTETKELFVQEVEPRNDVVRLLSTRREMRRGRRHRKTRYREPKFLNRTHSKKPGWVAPSVKVKVQEHVTSILRVTKILPVTEIIIESAEFDMQRIQALRDGKPLPEGKDYQNGRMKDFYNARQYVLFRDGYKCCNCGAHGEGVKFEVHHLESRKTGGGSPDNLITLCTKCHHLVSTGVLDAKLVKKRKRPSLRDAAFMGIMRKTLVAGLREQTDIPIRETYGYITKYLREKYDIKKSHINDARCISEHPLVTPCDMVYRTKAMRHHNRQLHRSVPAKGGIRKRAQAPYLVAGFRLWDKVLYNGKECFITSRRLSGSFSIKTFDDEMVKDGITYKKLRLLEKGSSYITTNERRSAWEQRYAIAMQRLKLKASQRSSTG